MERIKCPHCGAGNRENNETTLCWQCSEDLWAPVERQTYALGSIPRMTGTTFLGGSTSAGHSVPRWKLVVAALVAGISILLFASALLIYLDSRSMPQASGPPAINSTQPLR